MKKLLLEEEENIDFSVLGISCHLKDYRLCWEMNQALEVNLEKDEMIFSLDKKNESGFGTAYFSDEVNHLELMLINNKNEGGVLISEHPNLDYLLRISGPQHELEVSTIKEKLSGISIVLAIVELEPGSLKSIMNLIF